jgi:hypothetical protein
MPSTKSARSLQGFAYALTGLLCGLMLWGWQARQAQPHLAGLADFDVLCLSAESHVGDYAMPALAEGALQSMRQIARERSVTLACSAGALNVHYEMRSSAHTMRWDAVMTARDSVGTTLWQQRKGDKLEGATSLHQYQAGRFFSAFVDAWHTADE